MPERWGSGLLALLALLAGCEVLFPLSGPGRDAADLADAPAVADADPLAPDGAPDGAPDAPPPPPPDAVPCPSFECLSAFGANATVACAAAPYDYCQSMVLDALDPYDLCACEGTAMPFLYVVENGDSTAMVVLVSSGVSAAGLSVDSQVWCYPDAGGCPASTGCGNVDVLVWFDVAIAAIGNTFTVMDTGCTIPYYSFTRP